MHKVKMIAAGRVQGVGFRWGVKVLADQIDHIYGGVKNEEDGTVTILAQSDHPELLSQFIQEIRKGPSRVAKVNYLDVQLANFKDFTDFKILN